MSGLENNGNPYERIIRLVEGMEEELVAYRRDFHKYPEAGWFEMRTSSLIARRLTELGYEVLTGQEVCKRESRMGVPPERELQEQYDRALRQGADPEFVERTRGGMTGVIGILDCGPGPVAAMRFDIDALGVYEEEAPEHRPYREGFASVNSGVMHACGHDGHAAIGLGVAAVLVKLRGELRGKIKLIFQPSEEGVRGAKAIVDQGHLGDVDYFLASHISNRQVDPEGADVLPGYDGGLATVKYDVIFRGRAAHAAASPEEGRHAMLAAATAVLNLYGIPRHSKGASRINVGTIHGGSGRNVVADEVKLEMEVRGENTQVNDAMKEYALRILKGAADMHDVFVEVRVMGAADSLESSRPLMERVRGICKERLGLKVSDCISFPGGSEDVSYMVREVQAHKGEATFMRFFTEVPSAFHSRQFDFNEEALGMGVKIFSSVVYDILGDKEQGEKGAG